MRPPARPPAGDGILHRIRIPTGVPWRGLPERFGPWKTAYERHRLWSADGTWERLFRQTLAVADAAVGIDWDISVDSTVMRAHQDAAGARRTPPPVPSAAKGAPGPEHQNRTRRLGPLARLAAVVRRARAWAARAAGSVPGCI
ncbi:transposase [Streptomyces incarnatus]|uniref:Transposase n=1 Tax=Streptomyces incarnatus TaxID=665007 RepID=A0ABM5TX74_9ACTN|nr:transposase [Streptomyces incarnatus]